MIKQGYFEIKLQEKFDEYLLTSQIDKEPEYKPETVNYYELFLEEAKGDTLYEFEIWGMKQFYKPIFKVTNGKILSSCNCKAGVVNNPCWHRTYVLSGKTEYILNKNAATNLRMMAEAYSTTKAAENTQAVTSLKSNRSYGVRKAAFQTFFMLFSSIF